jgi:hypothetical protein
VIVLLLAQSIMTMTPIPHEMEAALDGYAQCLGEQIEAHQEQIARAPDPYEPIKAACAEARVQSIAIADDALSSNSAFSDATVRKAFVAQRFDFVDAMMAETFGGGMDPDKWDNDIAQN